MQLLASEQGTASSGGHAERCSRSNSRSTHSRGRGPRSLTGSWQLCICAEFNGNHRSPVIPGCCSGAVSPLVLRLSAFLSVQSISPLVTSWGGPHQKARLEGLDALRKSLFYVDGATHPVLRRPQRQVHHVDARRLDLRGPGREGHINSPAASTTPSTLDFAAPAAVLRGPAHCLPLGRPELWALQGATFWTLLMVYPRATGNCNFLKLIGGHFPVTSLSRVSNGAFSV